jgi:hypothetical protein
MKIRWNCGGGDTVTLNRRDKLASIPESHRDLVSPAVAEAFDDPIAYFGRVSARCPFDGLANYIDALISNKKWVLRLHTNGYGSKGIAAFAFKTEHVKSAELAPPEQSSQVPCFPGDITRKTTVPEWCPMKTVSFI